MFFPFGFSVASSLRDRHLPPTAVIFSRAFFENENAAAVMGWSMLPDPSTLPGIATTSFFLVYLLILLILISALPLPVLESLFAMSRHAGAFFSREFVVSVSISDNNIGLLDFDFFIILHRI